VATIASAAPTPLARGAPAGGL